MRSAAHLLLAAVITALLSCGCTATPLPEPPATTLDFDRIHGPEIAPATTVITIQGEPGAGPPGHVPRVTNLDALDDPTDVVIAEDGSFEISVAGGQGDELRFHTRSGRQRALPVDVVWSWAEIAPASRVDCLSLVPLQQQDLGFVAVGAAPATSEVVLTNHCADAIEVTAARLRRPSAEFAVGSAAPTLPAVVPTGGQIAWTLELSPGDVGDAEEIFFVELTAGAAAVRYPITLYGDGQ